MTEFTEASSTVPTYCEGLLKQQCLGEAGLYRWEEKDFRLHISSGILEVFPRNDEKEYKSEATLMSFSGAKHAKEWSISTPTIGSYGFDVVWDSGRIWSFLAKDMVTCNQWVQAINAAISHNPVKSLLQPIREKDSYCYVGEVDGRGTAGGKVSANEGSGIRKTSIFTEEDERRSLDTTRIEALTPGQYIHAANHATADKYHSAKSTTATATLHQEHQHEAVKSPGKRENVASTLRPESTDSDAHAHNDTNDPSSHTFNNISAIPLVPSSDGSPESCQSQGRGGGQEADRRVPLLDTVGNFTLSGVALDSSDHERPAHFGEDFTQAKHSHAATRHAPPVSTSSREQISSVSREIEERNEELRRLRQQYRDMELHNEDLQYEVDSSRLLLEERKEDASRRCSDLERQLAQAQEARVKKDIQHNQDLEQAVAQAQADSLSLHQLSSRAIKEQHNRELGCVQDELADERKRYGSMLLQEKKMRAQADTKESELRIKFSNLTERQSSLEKQLENDCAAFRAAKLSWEREKTELIRASETRLQKLEEEKEEAVFAAQEQARRKVDGMTANMNRSIREMEGSVQESCRQAFQTEKMLALTAMEKKNTSEVEMVRADERKRAGVELKKLRESFEQREKETMEDLQSLETLHQEQCMRLENEIRMYQKVITDNEMSWEDAKTENAKGEELKRRQTESHLIAVREHVQRAEQLETQLQQAHAEVQQARAEESRYREQLARVLEESKIQRAEYINVQRQCENDAALANSWRTASHESDLSLASYDTSLRIAREELAMVERNFSRVQDENKRLKEALQYADNVVYGNSIASMSVGAGNRGPRVSQLEGNRSLAGGEMMDSKRRVSNKGGKSQRSSWIPTYL